MRECWLRMFGLIHGIVAQEKFSETTIGYRNEEEGKVWKSILGEPTTLRHTLSSTLLIFVLDHRADSEKFKVSLIEDVAGVSLCGALKSESPQRHGRAVELCGQYVG
jgi:hypothetical protein